MRGDGRIAVMRLHRDRHWRRPRPPGPPATPGSVPRGDEADRCLVETRRVVTAPATSPGSDSTVAATVQTRTPRVPRRSSPDPSGTAAADVGQPPQPADRNRSEHPTAKFITLHAKKHPRRRPSPTSTPRGNRRVHCGWHDRWHDPRRGGRGDAVQDAEGVVRWCRRAARLLRRIGRGPDPGGWSVAWPDRLLPRPGRAGRPVVGPRPRCRGPVGRCDRR